MHAETGNHPSVKEVIKEESHQTNNGGSIMQVDSDVFLNIYDNAKELSDFSIKTKAKQYPIHKKILMVRSSKYYKLFLSDKAKEDVPVDVDMGNVTSEIMERAIIKFLYTEKVELTPDNVVDIIKVSTDLQLKSLKARCDEYLKTYTMNNVLPLIKVCKEKLLMKQLAREMTDFVYAKFPEIIRTESFAKLSLSDVCRLLGAYELRIHSEEKVFQAAMLWLNSNQDQIIKSAEELFKNIHFYCLSPRDIAAYLNINTDVLKVPACKTSVSNAFRFHAVQHWKNKMDSRPTPEDVNKKVVENVSGTNEIILCFGGTDLRTTDEDSAVSSEILVSRLDRNLQPEKWSQFGFMPVRRCFHCIVIACKDIYLIGGCDVKCCREDFLRPEPSNKAFRYDTKFGQWTEVSPMQDARMCFAATVVRDHIYVFGGLGINQRILAESECYAPHRNKWMPLTPMVYARAGLCAAPLTNDSILVMGGYAMNNNLKDLIAAVECYRLSQNCWTMKNPRHAGVSSSGLVAVNGYLYLLGGGTYNSQTRDIESTAVIETYLVHHDCWLPVATMDIPRLEMGTAVSSNLVYVVGGLCTQTNTPLSSVECFNASLSTMIRAPSTPMNLPRGLLGTRAVLMSS